LMAGHAEMKAWFMAHNWDKRFNEMTELLVVLYHISKSTCQVKKRCIRAKWETRW